MARAASNVHNNRQKDASIVRDRVSHIRPDSNFVKEKLQGKQTNKPNMPYFHHLCQMSSMLSIFKNFIKHIGLTNTIGGGTRCG